ncbi:TldD/PmbA family protein [Candidatus Bathyarchaeota archaeon]|nr:TldD/PmbA family protein [Candidatus Bathyarchaeota archaeon]
MILDLAEKAVSYALNFGAKYADARVEKVKVTSIRYAQGRFEAASSGLSFGIGVRALVNGAWGFASSSLTEEDESYIRNISKLAVDAGKAAAYQSKKEASIALFKPIKDEEKAFVKKDLALIDIEEKMNVAATLGEAAKKVNEKIASSSALYLDECGGKSIVTSDGVKVLKEVSRIYFSVKAIAKAGEKLTSIHESEGFISGFEVFNKIDLRKYAVKAAERALNMLKAKPAVKGRFKAVLDPKIAGTFIHEAVGHACEADYVINNQSILSGRLGEQIASEQVTVFDDSTLNGGWGSAKYDDEGIPTERRVLIENGFLKGYILNRECAKKLEMQGNGGARASSYSYKPIVRMSNTYLAPKNFSFEELMEAVKDGVYVKGSRGGQVDPAKGVFQFSAEEAFLISKGEVDKPLLDVSLSGSILETLKKIFAIGKDVKHHPGFCGKDSQFIPAGDGSPHIAVQEVIVGGRD